jgi:hypothetical protein
MLKKTIAAVLTLISVAFLAKLAINRNHSEA